LEYEDRLHYLYASREDRLRFGIKNKQAYFILLSVCTIFMLKHEDRLRFGIKKE